MNKVARELRAMRACVGRASSELTKASWALHCARNAMHNAEWHLKRSNVVCPGVAEELLSVLERIQAPWDVLELAKARADSLAAVLGAGRYGR